MKFLLLPGGWQEKTTQYYRNSLISERKLPEPESQGCFISDFFKNSLQQENELKKLQELKRRQEPLQKTIQEEPVQKIVQAKLSTFLDPKRKKSGKVDKLRYLSINLIQNEKLFWSPLTGWP